MEGCRQKTYGITSNGKGVDRMEAFSRRRTVSLSGVP